MVYDRPAPYQMNANILATPWTPIQNDKRVTILYDSSITPVMHEVEEAFIDRGYSVEFCSLTQTPSAGRDIIALIDLEEPFFGHVNASGFEAFKSLLGNLNSTGILWVTKFTQSGGGNPLFALVLGVARTLRIELSIDSGVFEVDNTQSLFCDTLQSVFEKFQRRTKDSDMDPEYEYAWIDGVVKVGRFHWKSIPQQFYEHQDVEHAKRLQIGKHGLLKTLFWEDYRPVAPVDSQVEIETRAIGMNFRVRIGLPDFLTFADQQDVLVSMGLVNSDQTDGDDNGSGLGCEASGVILRTGPDVKDLKPGDRVSTIGNCAFSTVLTTPASLCARIPDDMSFEQAATMPCVYSTAIYSLLELGQLDSNQVRSI